MKPPEVIFLSTDRILGGGEYFLKELLPELSKLGWRITLVSPPHSPLANDSSLAKIVEIITIDLSVKVRQWQVFLFSMFRFLGLVAQHRTAIFYSNGFFGMKALVLSTLVFQVKTICHLHESEYTCYRNRRSRWQAPLIDQFIAISRTVKNEFLRGTRINPEKVKLVHNGVPMEKASPLSIEEIRLERSALGIPTDALVVGMAARTNALKGHEVLLRAWEVVSRQWTGGRPILLLIAGLEPGRDEQAELYGRISSQITEMALTNIRCWGAIPIAQVRSLMRCADVWVVPSTSEGFGRTAIEAMAEGSALIASDVGGLSDIVESGVDGLLVPPGNSGALAAAISRLLDGPQERIRLAKAGQNKARSQFNLATMTSAIHGILVHLRDQ